MRKYLGLTVVLWGLLASRASAIPVDVVVSTAGPNQFKISLRTTVPAPQQAVWQVLTDYDHHVGILPYMTKSRITEKNETYWVVEQEGKIRVLFWTFTMACTQQVRHTPPNEMDFHAIAGDFERLEGTWLLATEGTGTRLSCDFVVQPKRHVPEWAVRFTARRYLTRMVESLAIHAKGSTS